MSQKNHPKQGQTAQKVYDFLGVQIEIGSHKIKKTSNTKKTKNRHRKRPETPKTNRKTRHQKNQQRQKIKTDTPNRHRKIPN